MLLSHVPIKEGDLLLWCVMGLTLMRGTGCSQARVLAGSARPPVAYVREHYVSSAATRAMAAALRAAEAEGCAGIIVDVRNDPGGVFERGHCAGTGH